MFFFFFPLWCGAYLVLGVDWTLCGIKAMPGVGWDLCLWHSVLGKGHISGGCCAPVLSSTSEGGGGWLWSSGVPKGLVKPERAYTKIHLSQIIRHQMRTASWPYSLTLFGNWQIRTFDLICWRFLCQTEPVVNIFFRTWSLCVVQ